jgi:23S rRNA pseudouridine2457 synthase
MYRYFVFHKPYQVLCQFSPDGEKQTLAHFFTDLPKNIYPVGRLDHDSEGLIILTDDKSLTHKLLTPSYEHQRTYWVQVDSEVTQDAIAMLSVGVTINVDGKMYRTKKAVASKFRSAPEVSDRNPPIRFRKDIPTSWLSLTLTEGKNRQVRKMTAAVGFPTLRLIRYAIEDLSLDGIAPGAYKELTAARLGKLLHMAI